MEKKTKELKTKKVITSKIDKYFIVISIFLFLAVLTEQNNRLFAMVSCIAGLVLIVLCLIDERREKIREKKEESLKKKEEKIKKRQKEKSRHNYSPDFESLDRQLILRKVNSIIEGSEDNEKAYTS